MTALTLSNIPSAINTYERLLVWAALSIPSAANGLTGAVVAGQGATPICQVQVGVDASNIERFVVSAYIPADQAALAASGQKIWMAAKDVVTSAPNTNFGSN
jgi:hypothetical protein